MVMALEVARQRGAFLRGVETSPAPWLQADGRCVGSGSGKITAATRGGAWCKDTGLNSAVPSALCSGLGIINSGAVSLTLTALRLAELALP